MSKSKYINSCSFQFRKAAQQILQTILVDLFKMNIIKFPLTYSSHIRRNLLENVFFVPTFMNRGKIVGKKMERFNNKLLDDKFCQMVIYFLQLFRQPCTKCSTYARQAKYQNDLFDVVILVLRSHVRKAHGKSLRTKVTKCIAKPIGKINSPTNPKNNACINPIPFSGKTVFFTSVFLYVFF